MRSLCVLVLAACLIGLAAPQPVHAGAENPTPGLWINPELGLATPEDAAVRYKAPFHTWRIEEDDPIRKDRRHAFLLFGGDWSEALESWRRLAWQELKNAQPKKFGLGGWHGRHWPAEIPPPPPGPAPLRVESCADMLVAYRAGLRLRPALELAWHGSSLNFFHLRVYLFDECLALEHLTRLQPLEGDFGDVPTFWGDRATVLRLSPVVFRTHSGNFIRDNLAAELSDTPHEVNARKIPWRPHAEDEIIEGPWWPSPGLRWNSWVSSVCEREDHPPNRWMTAFEDFCGENETDVLKRLWAVTASRDAQRASAFYFAPKAVVEGENNIHALTILGVGGLPEAAGLVLVVMTVKKLKGGSASAYDLLMPLVLNYDPDLDMFRVINFDDFNLMLRHDVP